MERRDEEQRKEIFLRALEGKNIPVLTLDHKWYRLLDELGQKEVKTSQEQLNVLLRRQGKLNTETKEIKRLKKKLMEEIVSMVDEAEQERNPETDRKIEQDKQLIEECNEKLESYQDELLELPRQIEYLNRHLMLETMESCYRTMERNTAEIQEITDWVTQVRIELKKRLINKQEMEQRNQEIYAYMHDIFGADVLDLFDMKWQ